MNNFNTYYFLIFLFFITSCSNDTSDNSYSEITKSNIVPINLTYWESTQKFKVIDGYVEGANVFVDWNFNNIQDDGEASAHWTGVTEPYEICDSWDVENDTCATTTLVDPPDNYYWWIDDSIIPSQAILDELEMTKEEWLLEAFPEYGGSPTFVNTGIDDYSYDCFNNTLKIADVPIGAYDSIRGQVTEPYKLHLTYGYYKETLKFSNITPFSTMLIKGVDNAKISPEVSDACNSDWWNEVTPHVDKIETLLDLIFNNTGIDRYYFFNDFITSNDENTILQAERIVDHLSTIYDIREIVSLNNNFESLHEQISNDALLSILSDPNFLSITFDLLAQELIINGWRKRIHYNDLIVNSSGELLINNSPTELTYENISLASSLHSIQNVYFASDDIIDFEFIDAQSIFYNSQLEREVQNKKSITYFDGFTNEISNDFYLYRNTNDSIRFILGINNPSNTLLPYDIDAIVDSADINAATDIYEIVSELPFDWLSIEVLENYIMDGDYLHLHKTDNNLSIDYEYSTNNINCSVTNTKSNTIIKSASNEDAYNLCNKYYE